MAEWTDPRYGSAVEMLTLMRSTGPKSPARRCTACQGYRFQVFLDQDGGRYWLGCPHCGESGERPAQPPRWRHR